MERFVRISCLALCLFYGASSYADNLAKLNQQTQDPIANLVSMPLQNNWTFRTGPNKETSYVMNFQPVIPFSLTKDMNVITRVVMPVVSQPRLALGTAKGVQGAFGLADTDVTFFLSPNSTNSIIWGIGPVVSVPTTTRISLGSNKWGLGPSIVALTQRGLWTVGVLANQIWSFGGTHEMPPNVAGYGYSVMFIQPFVSYSFWTVWNLSFTSETTCNWLAESGHRWTVPLDIVVSKIVILRKQAMSVGGGVRYFPINAGSSAVWGVRFVVSFLFPRNH